MNQGKVADVTDVVACTVVTQLAVLSVAQVVTGQERSRNFRRIIPQTRRGSIPSELSVIYLV